MKKIEDKKRMCKRISILLSFLLLALTSFAQPCIYVGSISADASLPNPCITYNIFGSLFNLDTNNQSFSVTYDFGDGSPLVTNYYTLTPYESINTREPHVYSTPGNYVVTFTLNGTACYSSSVQTTGVNVSGYCSSCPTYSNLSTGFDRANNIPFPLFPTSPSFDPYWYVVQRQDVSVAPSYTPIPGTIVNYTGVLAYHINPSLSYVGPIGTSRFISVNPTSQTVYQTINIYTYRTYFNLPNPLPTNKDYSLALSMRADDGIYRVTVNGNDIKPIGYGGTGGSYSGAPLNLGASSCNGVIQPGNNYIDIVVGDLGLSFTHMDAEILLYECNTVGLCPPPCSDCISSFAPIPGKKYLVSAWVKEQSPAQSKTSYTYPSVNILFPSIGGTLGPFAPAGNIIDGWQRIEGEFTIPANATDITVKLNCSTGNCFYDDVRVIPFDGSMKSYVYDPVNMRLVAELDERNYATLYEYDEEGKLIRVKKETEKGKMTIQENRNNTKK